MNEMRPKTLADYMGQDSIKSRLRIMISASKARTEALGHMLVFGGAGLGKTTLAEAVANEMGSTLKKVFAPNVKTTAELMQVVLTLQAGDILFIDEIHALDKATEEALLSVLEDFEFHYIAEWHDGSKRPMTHQLPRFTVMGATTRPDLIDSALLSRFIFQFHLQPHDAQSLAAIITKNLDLLGIQLGAYSCDLGIELLARCSRGNPRTAVNLCQQVRDFAQVLNGGVFDFKVARATLDASGIDDNGLTQADRKVLNVLSTRNTPVGVMTLSAAARENKDTIEQIIEPYLLEQGFIERFPRGRVITQKGIQALNWDGDKLRGK